MDLADDVAYSVHDLEDGVVARPDRPRLARRRRRRAPRCWQTVRDWYLPDVDDDELDDALGRSAASGSWPGASYDGSRRRAGRAQGPHQRPDRARSARRSATPPVTSYGDRPLVRYAADLVVPARDRAGDRRAQGRRRALRDARRRPGRACSSGSARCVTELVAAAAAARPEALMPVLRADFEAAADDAARLRVVVDQVASLTDASALAWHARLR